MDSLDKITLKAFIAALMRLDGSLPDPFQTQLNEIGKTFPSDVFQLHTLAKSYSPLTQEYMDARLALQKDGGRFPMADAEFACSAQLSDEKIINFAIEVLNADDSVNLVKTKAQESSVLGQILFQLRHQTSFMVRDAQNIPEEDLWIWQNLSAWASLERGLRQTAVGDVRYLGSFAQYADLDVDD
jgi:hypothetical protein